MAEDNFNVPQSQAVTLVAELISALQVRGRIGKLNISDLVSPVYIVDGSSRQLPGLAGGVVFVSGDIVSGQATAPAGNVIVVDTGPLPGGTYDVQIHNSFAMTGTPARAAVTHRNAANTTNLTTWEIAGSFDLFMNLNFAFVLQTNERLQVRTTNAFQATEIIAASIMTHLRPV